jgi:hypothetical protein
MGNCTQLHAQAAGALDPVTIRSHGRYETSRSKLRSFNRACSFISKNNKNDDLCGKVSL